MLGEAIGDLLPPAVGVALSPIPIVAVILMLGTPRARTTGPAFAAGWVLGLVAVSVIVLLLAGDAEERRHQHRRRRRGPAVRAAPALRGGQAVAGSAPARRGARDAEVDGRHRRVHGRASARLGRAPVRGHNAVIMAVVCLVLAAKLIGNAIGGLTD
jgi:Sap, sulfolipid-1-addressing protein